MTITGGRSPLQGPPRPRSSASESTPRSRVTPTQGSRGVGKEVAPGAAGSEAVTARPPRRALQGGTPPSDDSGTAASAPPESADPIRDALVSTRRYGATLNGLLSAIDNFARGVEAARSANDALCHKLERVQELLLATERDATQVRADLEQKVQELEQKLRSQRRAFEAERRFLTDEQDEFLRALLEEHEEQLASLREERDAALANAGGDTEGESLDALRREIATLRAERERSRALAQRMRTQRDEAQALLRRFEPRAELDPGHPTTPAPPPFSVGATLQVPRAPRTPKELRAESPSSGEPTTQAEAAPPARRDGSG